MSLVERACDLRARLMNPPNAVEDQGIDLARKRKSLTHGASDMKTVIDTVCRYYDIERNDLIGQKRHKHLVRPRQMAMYLGYTMTKLSLPALGDALGGRDHSTIWHGHRKIEELEKSDSEMATDLGAIRRRMRMGWEVKWSRFCIDKREI